MKSQNLINLIFDAGKGISSELSREYIPGDKIGELPRAVRNGYLFQGWYVNGQVLTSESVLDGESDITVKAVWLKNKNVKTVHDLYHKQLSAIVILVAVVVALTIGLLVANKVVGISVLTDTYVDESGTTQTDKYYIRKTGEEYSVYTKAFGGSQLEVNDDGYYIMPGSQNQYELDAETGEYELYAAVDYDAEGGETLGYSDRIMIFPQIKQTNVYSITVENQYGMYELYREKDGTVQVRGFEDNTYIAYDKELYAYLCVSCGYTLSMQKINAKSEQAPLLADGSFDYSVYGLDEPSATYTIVGARYDTEGNYYPDEDNTYVVDVGDAILSGAGYYVKLHGRDAVYIISDDIEKTVLEPVETMVTALVVYPTSMTTYSMGVNFIFSKLTDGFVTDVDTLSTKIEEGMIVAFSYEDLELRTNTLTTSSPYIVGLDLMKGYSMDDDHASTLFYNFYTMEYEKLVKLGFDKDDLHEYGFDSQECWYISYNPAALYQDSDGNNQVTYGYVDENGEEVYVATNMLIITKNKNTENTYYIASFLSEMIVEVDESYLNFLSWDESDWYSQYLFSYNISYMKDMNFKIGETNLSLHFDNYLSYYYSVTVTDATELAEAKKQIATGKEYPEQPYYEDSVKQSDGTYVTVIKKKITVDFGVTDEDCYCSDGECDLSPSTTYVKIYYSTTHDDFYGDGYDKATDSNKYYQLLDYSIEYTYTYNSGKQKAKVVSGVENFRYLYQQLLSLSLEGDFDAEEFEANIGMSAEEYIKTATPTAEISFNAEDLAKYLNLTTETNENGKTIRRYIENNQLNCVYRFYQYTDLKCLVTVETYEDGETPDPTNVECAFYTLITPLNKIETDIGKLLDGVENPTEENIIDKDTRY